MSASQKPLHDKRVLIVNDDGIDGPGIKLLEEIALTFTDDVWVVAPDEERSGAGQAISISQPIRYIQRDERHFAVRGTPTDCALLGINTFLEGRKPDILLSGINAGPNLAEDVHYSGTCAAAKEGALLGIPSFALSQMRSYGADTHWDASAAHLPGILAQLLGQSWAPGSFANVNIPNLPPEQITGIRITRQGQRQPGGFLPVRRVDERTVPYFWVKISPQPTELVEGTDLHAVAHGAISITPMQLDLTRHQALSGLETVFGAEAGSLGPVLAAADACI
ncbi:5'/3'-nucleotidase SurE [Novosphingobium rosa]|uniref:5'/3'-nucleotidase SurE n=1 Tax=Novosphingobium rosa TaxID=76978 RepID=UPI00083227A4|nr:5'/3'-nucleotidase SurE [Novosphingobium rosa]